MSARSSAVLLLFALTGCGSSYPIAPPATAVHAAPREVAPLRVYVYHGAVPPETPEDERDYKTTPGYTTNLRNSFQVALTQAGYTVVLDRKAPRDLEAVVHASWPYDRAGIATLTVRRGEDVVEQLSAVVQLLGTPPYTVHLEEQAAVDLADEMSRSQRVAAFARAHPRGVSEVAGPAP